MGKKTIKKVHRLTDWLISVGILILGLAFTILLPSWRWLGISLLITAAFMIPFYRSGYAIASQKGIFCKKEVLLPYECERQFAEYMEGISDHLDINPFREGGLLLEWYFKKEGSQNFGQLFAYDNNIYTPHSRLCELNEEQMDTILKYQSQSEL